MKIETSGRLGSLKEVFMMRVSLLLLFFSLLEAKDPETCLKNKTIYIPNVTQNLDLGTSQSPGVERSDLAHIFNMSDNLIVPTAGAFASSRNQILSHVGHTKELSPTKLIFWKCPRCHTKNKSWNTFCKKKGCDYNRLWHKDQK